MRKRNRLILILYFGSSLALESGEFSGSGEKNVKFSPDLELDLKCVSPAENCLTGRKISPKDRLIAILSPKRKSPKKKEIETEKDQQEEEIIISPRTRARFRKKCLSTDHPRGLASNSNSLKRAGSLEDGVYSIQSVKIAPKADNVICIRCVECFNFLKINEKNLIEELFMIIDHHGFDVIKNQSMSGRLSVTRNSEYFKKEYAILRDLWAPTIKKALSDRFKRLDFYLLVQEWNQIERFQNYVSVQKNSPLASSAQNLKPDEAWGEPIKAKIADWEKWLGPKESNMEENVPSPAKNVIVPLEPNFEENPVFPPKNGIASLEELQERIEQSTLSKAQKSYLNFLADDISNIIENAKVQHRIFFVELYLALVSRFNGDLIISSEKAKYMVLNNLFLYVIQLVLFDIRIEQTSFNKIEIGEFALNVLKDFSSRADMSEDEEDQLVSKIVTKMRGEATKRLQGPDFFEIQLMQILVQTFAVSEKKSFSEYQVILDAIKQRMIHLLLLL